MPRDPATQMRAELQRQLAAFPKLLAALKGLLENHLQLVNCGDCGSWDPETEAEVIAARAAIAAAEGEG